MKVTTGHNPHSYQKQRPHGNGKDKGFADMLVGMAYNRDREPEKQVKLDKCSFQTRMMNTHRHLGTQIKLNKESLMDRQPNAESNGDKELTGQQLFSLQRDYDIENLTPEARRSLLCDLTDMGVLSAADLSSDDQSKVDGVLEQIKAFKIGVGTYVELPEQPELLISDGSDPELRGLSDDEKFAAIFKKYDGGTTMDSFNQMRVALFKNKLITQEQSDMLRSLENGNDVIKRNVAERAQGKLFNLESYVKNYRVTMNDLFTEAARKNTFMNHSSRQLCEIDMNFLREFASKIETLSKESTN